GSMLDDLQSLTVDTHKLVSTSHRGDCEHDALPRSRALAPWMSRLRGGGTGRGDRGQRRCHECGEAHDGQVYQATHASTPTAMLLRRPALPTWQRRLRLRQRRNGGFKGSIWTSPRCVRTRHCCRRASARSCDRPISDGAPMHRVASGVRVHVQAERRPPLGQAVVCRVTDTLADILQIYRRTGVRLDPYLRPGGTLIRDRRCVSSV